MGIFLKLCSILNHAFVCSATLHTSLCSLLNHAFVCSAIEYHIIPLLSLQVPAGLFIPSLAVGACAGRIVGIGMEYLVE